MRDMDKFYYYLHIVKYLLSGTLLNSTGVIWTSIWDLFLENFLHDDNVRRSYSYNYTIQQISKLHFLPPP